MGGPGAGTIGGVHDGDGSWPPGAGEPGTTATLGEAALGDLATVRVSTDGRDAAAAAVRGGVVADVAGGWTADGAGRGVGCVSALLVFRPAGRDEPVAGPAVPQQDGVVTALSGTAGLGARRGPTAPTASTSNDAAAGAATSRTALRIAGSLLQSDPVSAANRGPHNDRAGAYTV